MVPFVRNGHWYIKGKMVKDKREDEKLKEEINIGMTFQGKVHIRRNKYIS